MKKHTNPLQSDHQHKKSSEPLEPVPRDGRGRDAERPTQINRAGWKDILKRVTREVGKDNLGLISAGVAFYALLAVFPALAAVVSTYGLIADPADVEAQMSRLYVMLPADVAEIIGDQLQAVATSSDGTLTFGVVFSILLAIWSANKGTKAFMTALNIAYEEPENRGFFKENAVSLSLTLASVVGLTVAVGLVAALPTALKFIGLGQGTEILLRIARWPLLAIGITAFTSMLYRWGPNRNPAQWGWLTPGAVLASLLWLAASAGFSWYVSNFGSYNETYGSLGAVVVMMMWLYISAFVLLIGAELNSEMEHQTARDTTIGEPAPRGQREAYMADHVARSADSRRPGSGRGGILARLKGLLPGRKHRPTPPEATVEEVDTSEAETEYAGDHFRPRSEDRIH